jgi:hypothetical protein
MEKEVMEGERCGEALVCFVWTPSSSFRFDFFSVLWLAVFKEASLTGG